MNQFLAHIFHLWLVQLNKVYRDKAFKNKRYEFSIDNIALFQITAFNVLNVIRTDIHYVMVLEDTTIYSKRSIATWQVLLKLWRLTTIVKEDYEIK